MNTSWKKTEEGFLSKKTFFRVTKAVQMMKGAKWTKKCNNCQHCHGKYGLEPPRPSRPPLGPSGACYQLLGTAGLGGWDEPMVATAPKYYITGHCAPNEKWTQYCSCRGKSLCQAVITHSSHRRPGKSLGSLMGQAFPRPLEQLEGIYVNLFEQQNLHKAFPWDP